ncbi:MAG: hypothetical protein AAF434_05710 [Pseudomonadota bacterium]
MSYKLAAAISVCTLVLLSQSFTHAAQPPSADEVKRVSSYFYSDEAKQPVLADYKLCTGIEREGDLKNNCTSEVPTDRLEPGQSLYLWMNFLVPKGERGKVLVQLNHAGVTRDTRVMPIEGSMRYRTWRKIRLLRPGDWELPIYYENSEGLEEVDRINLHVQSLDTDPVTGLSKLSMHKPTPVHPAY